MKKEANLKKIITVTSGKGGVGKSTLVFNIADAISKEGVDVIILDADLPLGNIDLFAGVKPLFTLKDVIKGERSLDEIIIEVKKGLKIIPTSSGDTELCHLTNKQELSLVSAFDNLKSNFDILLIDTDAGISSNVIYFSTISQEIVLVITPDPASLHDSLALINILSNRHGEKSFNVIVNCVKSKEEMASIFSTFSNMVDKENCDVRLNFIGSLNFDSKIINAVKKQTAVADLYPNSSSAKDIRKIAKSLMAIPSKPVPKGSLQILLKDFLEQSRETVKL
ncbi:MAG: MinD/ParA family protein [Candidatus Schekmanbacteria bacterium]|nr:MAG: MinD/ParA family protein [Candidatus Schekmanbacteria bacterium]